MTEFSLSGLIAILSQEKRLIQWLFDQPVGKISVDDPHFQEFIRNDKDRLTTLLQRKVLIYEEHFVCLNPYLFLPIYTQLSPSQKPSFHTINEILDRLKESVSDYENHSEKESARQDFFHILRFTGMLHIALLLFAESAESRVDDPSADIDSEMGKLQAVCREVSTFFNENAFLLAAEDKKLKEQIFQLNQTVRLIGDIMDTAEKQRNSLTTAESDFVKKLRQLKFLRDQQILKLRTNLEEVVDEEKSMIWEDPLTLNPLPDIEDSHVANPAAKPESGFSSRIDMSSEPDIFQLKDLFVKSRTDLYHFLAAHPAAQDWTEPEKTRIFFRMLSRFAGSFDILPDFIETADGKFPKIVAREDF